MALVILAQDWYAPGDFFIPRGEAGSIVEIPDALVPFLPSRAIVVDSTGKRLPKKVDTNPTLKDFDEARHAEEALAYAQKEADEHRARVEAVRQAKADEALAFGSGLGIPDAPEEPPLKGSMAELATREGTRRKPLKSE